MPDEFGNVDTTTAEPVAAESAPEPFAPEQPVPTSPDSTTPPVDDGHVRIPSEQLAPWDGRFGNVMNEAKKFRDGFNGGLYDEGVGDVVAAIKASGYTPAQFLAAMQEDDDQQDPSAAPDDASRPVTQADLEFAMAAAMEKTSAQQQQRNDMQQRNQIEQTSISDALKGAGFAINPDGQPADEKARVARVLLYDQVNCAIRESIPPHITGARREAEIKAAIQQPASMSVLKAAKDRWQQGLTDWGHEAVAQFTENQQGVPPASLNGGPGGRPPKKTWEQMTPSEKGDHITKFVAKSHGVE